VIPAEHSCPDNSCPLGCHFVHVQEGYAKRGAKQSAAIKEAASKVALLEASLAQVMADAEKERQRLLRTSAAQVGGARGTKASVAELAGCMLLQYSESWNCSWGIKMCHTWHMWWSIKLYMIGAQPF
jgi:hypothetical protein